MFLVKLIKTILAVLFWTLYLKYVVGLRIPLSYNFETEYTDIQFMEPVETNKRLRRESDTFPQRTEVYVQINGDKVRFKLKKNERLDLVVPIYMLQDDNVRHIENLQFKDVSFYQDLDMAASFLLEMKSSHPTETTLEIFGSFRLHSSHFFIQPSNSDDNLHVIFRIPEQTLVFEGLPFEESVFQQASNSTQTIYKRVKTNRHKRQTRKLQIELFSVTDYPIFTLWYSMTSGSNRSSQTVQMITQYLTYVLNAIDVRYKSIAGQDFVIDILNSGMFIADSPAASSWSETNQIQNKVDSSKALDSFSVWVKEQSNLPQFDHAMAFTGYDAVSSSKNGTSSDSSGIAYIGSLCTAQSISIVETTMNFITMTTAAHELGHSLGAQHDETGNKCLSSDNYIMAIANSVLNNVDVGQHLWQFSSCSISDIANYIKTLDSVSNNCMLKTSTLSRVVTTINQPMADVYPPDTTCSYTLGNESYVCRSVQNYQTMCTGIFCNQPGTTQCYSILPAEGTPCAKGKWCEKGQCVASSQAPTNVEDNCPLGDRPGLFDSTGKTCSDFVRSDPGNCYVFYTRTSCCESCNSVQRIDPVCQYGDHNRTFCALMSRFGCYNNELFCCEKCKPLKDGNITGCEFGDKYSGCMKENCKFYSPIDLNGCCETCYDHSSITAQTLTTIRITNSPGTPETTMRHVSGTAQNFTDQKGVITTESTSNLKGHDDWIIIAVGVGAGAFVMIVIFVVVCVVLRRRATKSVKKSTRRSSKDTTYDNIGFVPPNDSPAHLQSQFSVPTPRTSNDSSIQLNFRPIPPLEILDGYLFPSSSSVSSTIRSNGIQYAVTRGSNGVKYTAPNKPGFFLQNGGKQKEETCLIELTEAPKIGSRAVHYKRTSNASSGSVDLVESAPAICDPYDCIGDVPNIPCEQRPALPENHPRKQVTSEILETPSDVRKRFGRNNQLWSSLDSGENTSETLQGELTSQVPIPMLPPKAAPRTINTVSESQEQTDFLSKYINTHGRETHTNNSCNKVGVDNNRPIRKYSHRASTEQVSNQHISNIDNDCAIRLPKTCKKSTMQLKTMQSNEASFPRQPSSGDSECNQNRSEHNMAHTQSVQLFNRSAPINEILANDGYEPINGQATFTNYETKHAMNRPPQKQVHSINIGTCTSYKPNCQPVQTPRQTTLRRHDSAGEAAKPKTAYEYSANSSFEL